MSKQVSKLLSMLNLLVLAVYHNSNSICIYAFGSWNCKERM